MANKVLNFVISAKNQASSVLNKVGRQMKQVGKETEATNKDLSLQEVTLKGIAKAQAKVATEAKKAARASRSAGMGGLRGRFAGAVGFGGIRDSFRGIRRAGSATFSFIGRAARRAAGVGIAGFAALGLAINKAAEREKLTQTFSVLLGSVDEAAKRIQDLSRFAVETPFQLSELANANRLLQVFGGEVLGNIDMLRQLGDVAGATNNDLESLSFWFGRIVATTKSGVIDGEALRRLQEMGILSHEARKEMEKMGRTRDVSKVLEVWRKNTERFNGGMKTLSRTMSGLTSTFKDEINESLVQFGEQLLPSAKTAMDSLIGRIKSLRTDGSFKEWGQRTAEILAKVGETVSNLFGTPEQRNAAIKTMTDTLEEGVEKSLQVIDRLMPTIVEKFAIPIGAGVAKGLGRGVKSYFTGEDIQPRSMLGSRTREAIASGRVEAPMDRSGERMGFGEALAREIVFRESKREELLKSIDNTLKKGVEG